MAFHGTNQGMDIIELLKPWTEVVTEQVPGLARRLTDVASAKLGPADLQPVIDVDLAEVEQLTLRDMIEMNREQTRRWEATTRP